MKILFDWIPAPARRQEGRAFAGPAPLETRRMTCFRWFNGNYEEL